MRTILSTALLLASLSAGCAARHGALSKTAIRSAVRGHMGEIDGCYQVARDRRPELRAGGRLVMQLVIFPGGGVHRAKATEVPMADRDLASCTETAARRWRFPAPENDAVVVVDYPFDLHPVASP